MKQVIVTGGRDYDDWVMMAEVLSFIQPDLIIHGDCPTGADRMAQEWAEINGVEVRRYPADWSALGKKAGPIRNRKMLEENPNAVVIAFPGGSGTADCVKTAFKLNMIIMEVHE